MLTSKLRHDVWEEASHEIFPWEECSRQREQQIQRAEPGQPRSRCNYSVHLCGMRALPRALGPAHIVVPWMRLYVLRG